MPSLKLTIYNNNLGAHSRVSPWWICSGVINGRHVFGASSSIAKAIDLAFNA